MKCKKYILVLFLQFFLLFPCYGMGNEIEVQFVDVGQGNCTFIKPSQSPPILVDAGCSQKRSSKFSSLQQRYVIQEINNAIPPRVGNYDLHVITSHADEDHINWIKIITTLINYKIPNFKIQFLLGGAESDYEYSYKSLGKDPSPQLINSIKRDTLGIFLENDELYCKGPTAEKKKILRDNDNNGQNFEAQRFDRVVYGLNNTEEIREEDKRALFQHTISIDYIKPTAGILINHIDNLVKNGNATRTFVSTVLINQLPHITYGNFKLNFLPPINPLQDSNTNSLILKVTCGHHSAMLTGDATGNSTDYVLNHINEMQPPIPLNASIFQANHHGADTHESNKQDWLTEVNPKFAIFSAGKRKDYQHPRYSIALRALSLPNLIHTNQLPHEFHCGDYNANQLDPNLVHDRQDDRVNEFSIMKTARGIYNTTNSGTIVFRWNHTTGYDDLGLPVFIK